MRRLSRLATQIVLSNLSVLRSPYKLIYALTYRCQFTCRMCNIGRKEPSDELTIEEISKFFMKSHRFSWINLSGGELFLRKDFLDIVRVIGRHCTDLYLLNFPTNGYQTELIVASVDELLRSVPLPRLVVTVSLDGPPHLHDHIRNKPGSWDRAVETFRRLRLYKNRHFGVYLGMTLQDANVDAVEETVRSVQDRIADVDFSEFHLNIFHRSAHYYDNTDCGGISNRELFSKHLERAAVLHTAAKFNPVAFLDRKYQSMAKHFLMTGMSPVPCQALSASSFLAPDGTVYPCSVFDCPVGNIRDEGYDIGRIWNSDRHRVVREEIQKKNCPQCWTPCEAYQAMLAHMLPVYRR